MPAAFTVPTGRAHWQVLLRARAIEAGLFVVAAAQTGRHEDGRQTYGHSLVVDPWGEVLLDMGEEVGVGFADIDLARIPEVRSRIPALNHRRPIPERGAPMIVFDLHCLDGGETFEAWFRSSADYEEQQASGLVQCPVCRSGERGQGADGSARAAQGLGRSARPAGGDAGRAAQGFALGR